MKIKKPIIEIPFVDFEYIEYQVQNLEHRIHVLPEREMRRAIIVEFVAALTPEELVACLYIVDSKAAQGSSKSRELLQEMALEPSAVSELPYDTIQKSYRIARKCELKSVQGMFFGDNPKGSRTIDEVFSSNEYYDVSLGIRKQASRTTDRNVLDRLIHDRNWRVIALVLDNPRVVERDVVSIAARRPTQPKILEVISKHNKWSGRYRIRKSLVCNPYTPYPLARQLLGTLLQHDIKSLISMGAMPKRLREEAREILNSRRQIAGQKVYEVQQSQEDIDDIIAEATKLCGNIPVEDVTVVDPNDPDHGLEIDELTALVSEAEWALDNAVLVPVSDKEQE
jgi:hypothetical protein